MIVRDVSRAEVERIAATLDLRVHWRVGEVRALTAHPLSGSDRWRVTESGAYCCIHGYAALIGAILALHPKATVATTQAEDYHGLEDFRKRHPRVMKAMERQFGEGCTCRESRA